MRRRRRMAQLRSDPGRRRWWAHETVASETAPDAFDATVAGAGAAENPAEAAVPRESTEPRRIEQQVLRTRSDR